MRNYKVPDGDLSVSCIAYGCGSLAAWDRGPINQEEVAKAAVLLKTASDCGITLIDLADVYAFGKVESVVGTVFRQSPGLRQKFLVQTKCGQSVSETWSPGQPISANHSREHIVSSVEQSLRRLGTDYIDILLLHLVDVLAAPEEVARAFDDVQEAGKVRHFGVSNYNASQIELLRSHARHPIIVNQIHVGLSHPYAIADGNEFTLAATNGSFALINSAFTGLAGSATLDYCRLQGIQVQAWSPVRGDVGKTADKILARIANERGVSPTAIALAWLLKHPAGIVPIIGSTNPSHVVENCKAESVNLSRDEWYELFVATARLEGRTAGPT